MLDWLLPAAVEQGSALQKAKKASMARLYKEQSSRAWLDSTDQVLDVTAGAG